MRRGLRTVLPSVHRTRRAASQLEIAVGYHVGGGARHGYELRGEWDSLRRSRAGDVLLMAVRAEDGQPRSYLVNSILGVSPTQTSFSPRYPIELTPSGPQSIPATSRSAAPRISTRRRSRSRQSSAGPTYVFRCSVCRKLFERKSHDATLRPHKNPAGYPCYGSYGVFVRTKY